MSYTAPDGTDFGTDLRAYQKHIFNNYLVFRNQSDATLVKNPGEVNGQEFQLSQLENCTVLLLDHMDRIVASHLTNCKVFVGPCAESAVLRNLTDCQVTVASKELRMSDCTNCTVNSFSLAGVAFEFCSGIKLGTFNGAYCGLTAHFRAANLDPTANSTTVTDFSKLDESLPKPHYTLVSPSQNVPWEVATISGTELPVENPTLPGAPAEGAVPPAPANPLPELNPSLPVDDEAAAAPPVEAATPPDAPREDEEPLFQQSEGDAFAQPSEDAFAQPSEDAFAQPSEDAFAQPSEDAFAQPSEDAFAQPSEDAFAQPSEDAFAQPSEDAFAQPSEDAFAQPSEDAFAQPSEDAFAEPQVDESQYQTLEEDNAFGDDQVVAGGEADNAFEYSPPADVQEDQEDPAAYFAQPEEPVVEEPDAMQDWRIKYNESMRKKDEEQLAKREAMKEQAEEELEEYYSTRANTNAMRAAQNREEEESFVTSINEAAAKSADSPWARVLSLVDLTVDPNDSKDKTRFRQVILQRKEAESK